MALGLAVSLKSAVVASAVLGLGLMIPAAPGGLGTYELFGTESVQTGRNRRQQRTGADGGHSRLGICGEHCFGNLCLLAVKGISLAQLRHRLDVAAPAEIHDSTVQLIRPA